MTDQPNSPQTAPWQEAPAAPDAPAITPVANPGGSWLQRNRQTAIIGGAVIVIVIAAIIAFTVGGDDKKSSDNNANTNTNTEQTTNVQVGLNADGLKTAVAAVGRAVYWAGAETDYTYVLQTFGNGQTTVRYVPKDGDPNNQEAVYRVMGSYPIKDAFGVTTKAGQTEGSVLLTNSDGSIVVYNKAKTSNVYVAFPGVDVQIEIFDPTPGKALEVATSGKITPVG